MIADGDGNLLPGRVGLAPVASRPALIENIERISNTLEKKRKPKVKQQRGCVGLQVGGEIIPIRE